MNDSRSAPHQRCPAMQWLAGLLLVSYGGCGASQAPEPLPPPDEVNLLTPFLTHGVPSEIRSFSSSDGEFFVEHVSGGRRREQSLLIEGDGQFGGTNVGRIPLEGVKGYVATAFVDCSEGQAFIKLDYYRKDEHLGSTQSAAARRGGWQQLAALSQRSRFPTATHLVVVAVCRGKTKARYDDFALVEQ